MKTMGDEGEKTCPICAEEMDFTDKQLKPCKCGYEICVWCWHHVMDMAEKEDSEGRCPACRTPYDREKIVGMAVDCERMVAEINSERRLKSQKAKSKTSEGRRHLSSVRVIQRNLVYIIGIPAHLEDEDILAQKEYFGQYGKVLKVSISRPAGGGQNSLGNNTFSVYITYSKEEEAVRCIQSVHGFTLEGRSLRACYGTTKYCNTWLRNMPCNNPDCLYLHEIGTQEDSFTKDEIISAYSRSRVLQITGASNNAQRSGNVLPPPADECNSSAVSSSKLMVKSVSNSPTSPLKCSPPNSSSGRSSALPATASWGLRASNCWPPVANTVHLQGSARHKADTFNGSSAFSSAVVSSAPGITLHEMGNTSVVAKESCLLHLNGTYGSPGYSKQFINIEHRVSEDEPSEVLRDASCATVSSTNHSSPCAPEEKDRCIRVSSTSPSSKHSMRQQSLFSSDPGNVGCDCLPADGSLESLCSGLSSIDVNSILGLEFPDKDKQRSSVSGHISWRSPGSPCSSENGIDLMESLTSPPLGKIVPKYESMHVSRELPNWSPAFQTQAVVAAGNQMDEDLLPIDQGLKLSEDDTDPPYLPSSWKAHQDLKNSSWQDITDITNHPGISHPRTKDAVVNEASFPFPAGGSVLSDGFKEDKFRISNSDSSKSFQCPDVFPTVEEVQHTEKFDGDVSETSKTSGVDLWESNIITNILSMEFDACNDSLSLPLSLAELLNETDKQNGSFSLSSSWKSQNCSQSRFSFARQEDFVNQASQLEPSSSNTKLLQKKCFASQESLENWGSYGDKPQNGFVGYSFGDSSSLISNLSVLSTKVSVSKAQVSVPPGFSVPSRAPPGFSSQQRTDRTIDVSGNQLIGNSSLLKNQCQLPLTGDNGNIGDVEFIDPAILAVGEGKFPLGRTSDSCLDSAPCFQAQLSTSECDPRTWLLMRASKSSHQNQSSNHMASTLSPLNDAYISSGLVEHRQTQGTSLSHRHFVQLSGNGCMSNSMCDNWNEVQNSNHLAVSEIVRNERFRLDEYSPGYNDLRFHRSTSGDLYNRAFGM